MRQKKVWRYYCDFCKKAGCNKYWIVKHEVGCTKNPNRTCGFCKIADMPQPKMADLLAALPNPDDYIEDVEYGGKSYTKLENILAEKLPALRDAAENCPACIMAALRQKGIPVPVAKDFDFKKECQSVWDAFNAEQLEQESSGVYGY